VTDPYDLLLGNSSINEELNLIFVAKNICFYWYEYFLIWDFNLYLPSFSMSIRIRLLEAYDGLSFFI
jgi:hypothetical protein